MLSKAVRNASLSNAIWGSYESKND